MRNALTTGRANRHVLRSAAALFAHLGEPDAGLTVLRNAPGLASDPWLQAAEIALSQLAETGSRTAKAGRLDLLRSQHEPRNSSELASAIASLEAASGHDQKARELLQLAVVSPTENAVAQVEVEAKRVRFEVPEAVLMREGRHEAQARDHLERRSWRASVDAAIQWQQDQKFSLEAAVFASFVASAGLEDYEVAITVASLGLVANPNDATLLNNLAFASASLGRVDDAESALRRVDERSIDPYESCVVLATQGLVAFRRGAAPAGRALYLDAIRAAERAGLREPAVRARAYLAREEVLSGTDEAAAALETARQAAQRIRSGMAQLVIDRVDASTALRNELRNRSNGWQ
jgi:tetratricopeptide (TPR) repeat protein